MNTHDLTGTVAALMGGGKGLLAMDESTPTCNKRFAAAGIPQTEAMRRAYREMIVTAPGLGDAISGAILFDETMRQKLGDGRSFVEALHAVGIIPGIKVDAGTVDLPGFPKEKVTEGLDGLADRLKEYAAMGARFAKWRAVITIGSGIPSRECIEANAGALALYALLCQAAGLVPIVEPEVLMDGDHTIERCEQASRLTLRIVFERLNAFRADLAGLLLKPAMVVSGKDCPRQAAAEEVADHTVAVLRDTVPGAVGGVAFLSGGQTGEEACARLNAMHVRHGAELPWPLTYSFSRAIQHPALEVWGGKAENVRAAQDALVRRAQFSRAARAGRYSGES